MQTLLEKEKSLKLEEEMTRKLGTGFSNSNSELKTSNDRNLEYEKKYESLTTEFKALQVKSIELEKKSLEEI